MRYAAFVLILLAGTANAQDTEIDNAKQSIIKDLTFFTYEKFGARWKSVAVLRACDKYGIASMLEVPDYIDTLGKEFQRLVHSSDGKYAVLGRLPSREQTAIMGTVDYASTAYRAGYEESMLMLKDNYPDVYEELCQAAIVLADKLLSAD